MISSPVRMSYKRPVNVSKTNFILGLLVATSFVERESGIPQERGMPERASKRLMAQRESANRQTPAAASEEIKSLIVPCR